MDFRLFFTILALLFNAIVVASNHKRFVEKKHFPLTELNKNSGSKKKLTDATLCKSQNLGVVGS